MSIIKYSNSVNRAEIMQNKNLLTRQIHLGDEAGRSSIIYILANATKCPGFSANEDTTAIRFLRTARVIGKV